MGLSTRRGIGCETANTLIYGFLGLEFRFGTGRLTNLLVAILEVDRSGSFWGNYGPQLRAW